jgi:hypothetical protein
MMRFLADLAGHAEDGSGTKPLAGRAVRQSVDDGPTGKVPALPTLLTTEEVAAIFRRDLRTICRWKETKGLIPVSAGRYLAADIEALIRRRLKAAAVSRMGRRPSLLIPVRY